MLADAVRRKGLTVERVRSAAEAMGGRAGLLDLRAACDELDPSLESVLEEEALPHLLKLGLGDLVRQYEVRDREGRLLARLDFACVRLRLAIEVDGWASHSDPVARSRDSRRDRLLTAEGDRAQGDDSRRTTSAARHAARGRAGGGSAGGLGGLRACRAVKIVVQRGSV